MRVTSALRALAGKIKFWFALVGLILLVVSGLIFESVTQLINSGRRIVNRTQAITNLSLNNSR